VTVSRSGAALGRSDTLSGCLTDSRASADAGSMCPTSRGRRSSRSSRTGSAHSAASRAAPRRSKSIGRPRRGTRIEGAPFGRPNRRSGDGPFYASALDATMPSRPRPLAGRCPSMRSGSHVSSRVASPWSRSSSAACR